VSLKDIEHNLSNVIIYKSRSLQVIRIVLGLEGSVFGPVLGLEIYEDLAPGLDREPSVLVSTTAEKSMAQQSSENA